MFLSSFNEVHKITCQDKNKELRESLHENKDEVFRQHMETKSYHEVSQLVTRQMR